MIADPKTGIAWLTLPPEGAVSLGDFQAWIDTAINEVDGSQMLSELFGDLTPILDEEGATVGAEGSIGIKYGLRLSYIPPTPISFSVDNSRAEFLSASEELIPIASVEIDVLDKEFSELTTEGYEQSAREGEVIISECLKDKLEQTPEYLALFKYAINLPRLMSLCAIYNSRAFLPSIGQDIALEDDGGKLSSVLGEDWSDAPLPKPPIIEDGEWYESALDSRGFNWYKWDKEVFKKVKKDARVLFDSSWNYREPLSINAELNFELSKNLRDLMNFNFDGVPMNWIFRRRLIDRPFNKDDEECE